MNQIRVLLLMDGFFVGGTETQVLSTIPELIRLGVHVVVVGADGPLVGRFRQLGCTTYIINFPLTPNVEQSEWTSLNQAMENIITREKINVVHAHQLPSGRFVQHFVQKGWFPLVFTVHGNYYEPAAISATLHRRTKVLSVSASMQEWLGSHGISSTLLPNGIDLAQYRTIKPESVRFRWALPDSAPVVAYASRLAWQKADLCVQVIEASLRLRQEKYPELHMLIAGGGARYEEVSQAVLQAHRTARVEFIRLLGEQADMTPIYGASDCVVGTGRVALEAMACERPLVAAGVCGLVGVIRPENFELARQQHFGDHKANRQWDVNSLYALMGEILSSPAQFRQYLGSEGRRFVKQHFDIHVIGERLVEIYRSLL